jgi:hypothetical protein
VHQCWFEAAKNVTVKMSVLKCLEKAKEDDVLDLCVFKCSLSASYLELPQINIDERQTM